jgi:hypothetical protein
MKKLEKPVREPWREIFAGGSAEAENQQFLSLAADMLRMQESNRERATVSHAMRTLHAKIIFGVTNARLIVNSNLPARFNVGYFNAGMILPTVVRLSNASGLVQPDASPDMRGMALRISLPSGSFHDLLATNYPVSHARNARQFVDFARIASGDRATLVQRLTEHFGADETSRMLSNMSKGLRPCASFALERFWSRGAVLWGDAGPVRFNFRPALADSADTSEAVSSADGLTAEIAARLMKADVTYHMALQEFSSETQTPIEDGAVEWMEDVTPSIDVATLVIPKNDRAPIDPEMTGAVDSLAFNPWNAPAEFRPLGNLMRARKIVYAASAKGWQKR